MASSMSVCQESILFQNIHFFTENLFAPIRCLAAETYLQERWRKQPRTGQAGTKVHSPKPIRFVAPPFFPG